jgi:hypothetical protein
MAAPVEVEEPPYMEDFAESVVDPYLPEIAEQEEPEANGDGDGGEDDIPDILKRVEEMLAYLDSPVNPDLPEPVYALPEPEADENAEAAVSVDAEAVIEIAEAGAEILPAEEESPDPVELEETVLADGTGSEDEAVEPVEEAPPVPPAMLRPPKEIASAPQRRESPALPLSVLPMLPTRIPASETFIVTERQSEKVSPIQTIQVVLGENVEVVLSGSGWVYLGEADGQRGISYQRRRISDEGQVFVLRAEAIGFYQLQFKKQDLLRGVDTDEIVEVTVVEKGSPGGGLAANTETVPAVQPSVQMAAEPAAPPAVETKSPAGEGDAIGENMAAESATPIVPAAEPSVAVSEDDTASSVVAAPAVTGDETLWNRGQALEVPGPDRDIKGALSAYKTLVRDYPQSEYYTESQKRIAYIERFFVNIR